MDTREWTDGVLTFSARQVVKEPGEVQSWIICDGDIDPEWIESLNSVLDDNRCGLVISVRYLYDIHTVERSSHPDAKVHKQYKMICTGEPGCC